ncbi:DUF4870 domain-containing protein [Alkaliphilus serpentinus]|uniref:DUF4870 domain-containing protein n=1 Tax=Alkaliphilus serpentinus TaxID=1482731 RepID=A0A833HPR3_9FIRM|nr:DUF4870 domain-containing protein [Alkaliphilus serpentinus]KAB3531098.1 DUF4870 domain-containing protein [Alkaliphilus serpentinus]
MSNVKTVEPHKSSLGMDANIAVLITYLGGVVIGWLPAIGYVSWLVPLIIFILEKESDFVRFHSMQSLILNAVGALLGLIIVIFSGAIATTFFYSPAAGLGFLGILSLLTTIISIVILVFAILAVINGFKYKEYKIPVIGNLAEKLSVKFKGVTGKSE